MEVSEACRERVEGVVKRVEESGEKGRLGEFMAELIESLGNEEGGEVAKCW